MSCCGCRNSLAGVAELFREIEEGVGEGISTALEFLKVRERCSPDRESYDDLSVLKADFQIFNIHVVLLTR